MPVSDRLDIPALTEAMSQKATAVNTAVDRMTRVLTAKVTIDCSTAVSAGTDDIFLPYDDSNDLSDRSGLHCMFIELTGTPSVPFNLHHPDKEHVFFLKNSSGQEVTVRTLVNALPSVTLDNGATAILFCDGVGVIDLSSTFGQGATSNTSQPYDVQFAVFGKPTAAEEVIGSMVAARNINFAADFAGSHVIHQVTPTEAIAQFIIKDDGTEIGRVGIRDDDTTEFVTTDNNPVNVAAGSLITCEAPDPLDATLETVQIALVGSVQV